MPTLNQLKKLRGITDPLARRRYLKYFQLPQDVRQLVFAVETANKMNAAAKKNKLTDKQIWSASYVAGMVLLGETNIVDFVKSLMKECNLNEQSARQLARDINSSIFLPVKESLKKIHKVPEWPREEEPSRPISQPDVPQKDHEIVTLKEKKSEIPSNIVNLKEE